MSRGCGNYIEPAKDDVVFVDEVLKVEENSVELPDVLLDFLVDGSDLRLEGARFFACKAIR